MIPFASIAIAFASTALATIAIASIAIAIIFVYNAIAINTNATIAIIFVYNTIATNTNTNTIAMNPAMLASASCLSAFFTKQSLSLQFSFAKGLFIRHAITVIMLSAHVLI